MRTYADLRRGHRRRFSVQGPTLLAPSETLASACSQPQGYEHEGIILTGNRTRVYNPPRAFLNVSSSYAVLTQRRTPGIQIRRGVLIP